MLSIDKLLLKGFVVGSKEMTKDTTSDSDLDFGGVIGKTRIGMYHQNGEQLLYQILNSDDLMNRIVLSISGKDAINGDYVELINSAGEVMHFSSLGYGNRCFKPRNTRMFRTCQFVMFLTDSEDLPAGSYKFIAHYKNGSRKIHKIKIVTQLMNK